MPALSLTKAASRLQVDAWFCFSVFVLVTATRQRVVVSVRWTPPVFGKRPSFWAPMSFLWKAPPQLMALSLAFPPQPACWFAAQCGRIPARSGCTPVIRRWGWVWACIEPRVEWLLRSQKSLSLNTLGISKANITTSSNVGYRLWEVPFFKKNYYNC